MIALSLREIASITGGSVVQGNAATVFDTVATDTRKMRPKALFFALIGERHDGHSFLPQAVANGAGDWLSAVGRICRRVCPRLWFRIH
ncbi:MAG: Mur ligase domain-containing protein [Pelotomaculum sp.]